VSPQELITLLLSAHLVLVVQLEHLLAVQVATLFLALLHLLVAEAAQKV
jgi:hypothetical protein